MSFSTLLAACLSLAATGHPAYAAPTVQYSVEDGAEPYEKQLVVTFGAKRLQGPTDAYVDIVGVRDFDRDGVNDALVSTWVGGTCCAHVYQFVTVKHGAVFVASIVHEAALTTLANAEYSIVDDAGVPSVFEKTSEETLVYRFDGQKAVRVRSIPRLSAEVEIFGVSVQYYDGPVKTRSLSFDLDGDGREENVQCEIWTRWGSLRCELPLPDGTTQSLHNGCDRFGVLKTSSHGYRDVVCNNDEVIRFDGSKWGAGG